MVTPKTHLNQPGVIIDDGEVLTTGEIQSLGRVTHVAVYKWVKAGKLNPIRVGKSMGIHGGRMKLFRRDEVLRFLAKRNAKRARAKHTK